MPKLNWDGNDFRNPQDSSGTVADMISRNGSLQQGYFHGSLTEGLVAYYPFEAGTGSTVTDEALGNDGSINGASWVSGAIGDYSLSFDGGSDYVGVDSLGDTDVEPPFTLSAWFNSNVDETEARSELIQTQSKKWHIRIEDRGDGGFGSPGNTFNPGLGLHIQNSADDLWYVVSFPTPTDTWHHVTAVFDGQDMKIFLDGVLQDSYSFGSQITIKNDNLSTTSFGARPDGTNPWDGEIDDVRIYDRKLSTPEIKALYNLTAPSKVSPDDTLQ
ncbi:LamG domain-containing protein [Candidatus Nanosalina sp. VS9-1]|uniref:LamG domain-containing protein n=1 Tax=Candidatus Nanosalina sp. VS9-1 TaxID=3388566 RepID=UPI0039E01013